MTDWLEDEHEPCLTEQRWPMAPAPPPASRAMAVVGAAVDRRDRARRALPAQSRPRTGGRTACRSRRWRRWPPGSPRYDSGEWDDPPGKLALLYDIERVRQLVRGQDPFDPNRDRAAFCRFLIDAECQPPRGPAAGRMTKLSG